MEPPPPTVPCDINVLEVSKLIKNGDSVVGRDGDALSMLNAGAFSQRTRLSAYQGISCSGADVSEWYALFEGLLDLLSSNAPVLFVVTAGRTVGYLSRTGHA
jgi:hypothetical protein